MRSISWTRTLLVAALAIVAVWIVLFRWVQRDPFDEFVVLYAFGLITVLAAGYLVAFLVLLSGLRWAVNREPDPPSVKPVWLHLSAHGYLFGTLVALAVVNKLFLPWRYHPMSLATDAVVALIVLVILWAIMTRRPVRALLSLPALALGIVTMILANSSSSTETVSEQVAIRMQATLPYVSYAPTSDLERDGVTYHDEELTCPGLNLFVPKGTHHASLMDMQGNIVHEWSAEVSEGDLWGHVELQPDGDLLVTISGNGRLICVDWDSNVKWVDDRRFYHHDVAVADNGDVYTLTRQEEMVEFLGLTAPMLNDCITIIDGTDRSIKKEISLFSLLGDRFNRGRMLVDRYRFLAIPPMLRRLYENHFAINGPPIDVFHANTLEIIDRGTGDVFRRGNVLFCSRTLSTVGVIDPDAGELLWTWGSGVLDWPHYPTLLDNGNILVYDNGPHRGYTRILELDPRTEAIVWSYQSDPPDAFFSRFRGANQRFENGNTLITDGDNGIAFEINADGQIVWEYYNPLFLEEFGARSALYRVNRFTSAEGFPCLDPFFRATSSDS